MKAFYIIAIFSLTTLSHLKVSNGLPALLSQQSDDKTCKACTALVSFVDKMSRNNSDHSLENGLIRLCNDYSALPGQQTTKMCSFIVYDLLNMFKNVNNKTFCNEISACLYESSEPNNQIQVDTSDDVTCDFCQSVVTNIKDIVSGQPTELEIKYMVEDACHYLGSFENECVSLSDEYLDSLFNFIRQSLQPKKFCQSIGACPKALNKQKQIEKVAEISEIVNIFPAQIPLTPLTNAEPLKKESDDIECLLCKRLVQYVVQELKDNRTEEQIEAALSRVCNLFPKKDRNQCNSFVTQYTDELIHILIEEADPELACTLLGVCVPKSVWQSINRFRESETSDNTESQKPNKWQEIEPSIEVESSDSESLMINSKVDSLKSSKLCYECELVMHFIQTEIYNYNTEEQIEEFVENQLCDRLTVVITKEACDSFVREYGPQVLQLIAQKLFDPTTVCQQELRLCPNTTQSIKTSQQTESDFTIDRVSEKCQLCVSLVQQMDALLESDQFDKEVAKIVEKTCKALSNDKQTECELMVEAFAPYFLQMIGHLSNANQICKSIDMCYTTGTVHLLGGHKCTFGPSYWCHTIAHAEACKATHFCKNKVWKAMP